MFEGARRGAFAVRDAAAERARNRSAIAGMCGSKSPGTERFSAPARSLRPGLVTRAVRSLRGR